MHFMRAQTSKTSLPEGQTKNSLIAKELGHKSWVSQGTKSSGMGLWQSMVAWISGRLNHPRARPAVIKALEIEPPMNLSMKDGKTRRLGDLPWGSKPPEKLSSTREDHWRIILWKARPPG